jgi:hypothetical protein
MAALLVDAANGFNELSRKAMLWTIRHRWASGARYAFNCYRHSAQLILRRPAKACVIILSREGVTQGDPLAMVLYGLTMVPLAEALRAAVPSVIQPWYADDAAMTGPIAGIGEAQRLLCAWGPHRGYFPEPGKSVLIVGATTPHADLAPVAEFNFQRQEGHRYVGGFVGSPTTEAAWIAPQVHQWTCGVDSLASVARRHPQTAFAGLAKSLQAEWQYLQRVSPGTGGHFAPIEDAIATRFLPALLDCGAAEAAKIRDLLALPIRLGGLGIPDPTTTGDHCYESSVELTAVLQSSLLEGSPFSAVAHQASATEARRAAHQRHTKDLTARLEEILQSATPTEGRRIRRSAETGAWLTALPNLLNGTDLAPDEFRDSLRLRFGLAPKALPTRCDGCDARFTTEHALSCRKGGLVLQRHNDVAAEWGQLCGQALTPSVVTDEPLIHTGRHDRQVRAGSTEPPPAIRGDIAVHGFWRRGTTAIFDIRVTDTDAPSNRNTAPSRILRKHEEEKKAKHNALCLAQRRHFTPLVFSVDGLNGAEAKAATQRLASLLAAKWKRTYSDVCGYIRSRLAVALVRSTTRCLRASRTPFQRAPHIPWDSGSGLSLYR